MKSISSTVYQTKCSTVLFILELQGLEMSRETDYPLAGFDGRVAGYGDPSVDSFLNVKK